MERVLEGQGVVIVDTELTGIPRHRLVALNLDELIRKSILPSRPTEEQVADLGRDIGAFYSYDSGRFTLYAWKKSA